MLNFSDALKSVQDKDRLRGIKTPPSTIASIAEGYSENAASRLTKIRSLELQKEQQDEQKRQFAVEEARNEQDRRDANRAARKANQAGGYTAAGTIIGAVAGTAVGGPYGAAIGAAVGAIAGSCIIISACTSKDSYEVNIAREFRDKYLSNTQLGGYYAIGIPVVKLIHKSHFFKLIVKKCLVDRLVDYGEWILGYKPKMRFRTSEIVTNSFLKLCGLIGMQINITPLIEAHR